VTDDGRDPSISIRVPEWLKREMEALADESGLSVSEVWRRSGEFTLAAHDQDIQEQADLEDELDEKKELNLKRDRIAGFSGRVHDMLEKRIKGMYSPKGLRSVAVGYREEAEIRERQAEVIPDAMPVEEGELVAVVDRELREALQAADLTNWYERHGNSYETITGVREGREERQQLIALVQGLLESHGQVINAFQHAENAPAVDPKDLPPMADSLLPERLGRDEVAEAVTRMAREGVEPEDVPDVLPDVDPRLAVEDPDVVEAQTVRSELTNGHDQADDGGDDAGDDGPLGLDDIPEDATIRRGGVPLDALDGGDTDDEQAQLPEPAVHADGGRSADAVPPTNEDDDMDRHTPHTDDDAQQTTSATTEESR